MVSIKMYLLVNLLAESDFHLLSNHAKCIKNLFPKKLFSPSFT